MKFNVVTSEEYKNARDKSDSIWSDFEVFEEERDTVPLREIVCEVVESQYTHPAGPDSVYGMTSSAEELVREYVFNEFTPEEVPKEVKEQFANNLIEVVQFNSEKLYKQMKVAIEPEDDTISLSEVQEKMNEIAPKLVPETY